MKFNKKTIEKDEEYLRQVSKEVNLENNDYKEVVKMLHEYCENSDNCMAMASVQLGIPLRLIYVKKTNEKRMYEDYNESKVLINPVVLNREGLVRYYEACVSCLNYMGLVERPYKIEIEYYTIEREKVIETFENLAAVVLSHELDHLDGVLHIDKSIELYDMPKEERKEFREKHKLEIIRKDGTYKLTTTNFKKINDIKKLKLK